MIFLEIVMLSRGLFSLMLFFFFCFWLKVPLVELALTIEINFPLRKYSRKCPYDINISMVLLFILFEPFFFWNPSFFFSPQNFPPSKEPKQQVQCDCVAQYHSVSQCGLCWHFKPCDSMNKAWCGGQQGGQGITSSPSVWWLQTSQSP